MPELPEVETVVRALRAPLIGRTITALHVAWPRTLHAPQAPIFAARIAGQTVQEVQRRAKYILVQLTHDTLIIHLRMTGRLYVVPDAACEYADQWTRVTFQLDNAHQLRFSDARKFGRCTLTADPGAELGELGPEPLSDDFTPAVLRARLAGRSGRLKPLLLDQHLIAGLGNIYADEALFAARLHPLDPADALDDGALIRLHAAIRQVLQDGIAREGASVNWYRKPDGTKGSAQESLCVYGRAGEPCPRCGTPIARTVVAQRGTHYCPACQTPAAGRY